MNKSVLWLIFTVLLLMGTAPAVFADRDGNACWCNIDQYGCRIADENNASIYIMFWSEEARQFIMGTGSAPYQLVVRHPGFTGKLPMDCGTGIPEGRNEDQPGNDCSRLLSECRQLCDRADQCSDPEQNSIDIKACYADCQRNYLKCTGK